MDAYARTRAPVFWRPCSHRALHSFPTRRSSDLSLDDLRSEQLILMQEGAGVREVVEDELRNLGVRIKDLDARLELGDRKSTRLNSSHSSISYAAFRLKKTNDRAT